MKAKKISEHDLKPNELEFIRRYGISIDQILDVRGMIPIGQRRALEASGCRLGLTDRRCRTGQHRLKTRSGHCPMCSPKNLAFEKRHSETADVYVCSSQTGLVKVGCAADPKEREKRLNREKFASCRTWQLEFSVRTERAAKVEALAHKQLEKHLSYEMYDKSGVSVTSREVFMCSTEQAVEAIQHALNALGHETKGTV